MIKAIAILTKGDKTEILATGRAGECLKVAREAGLKISPRGAARTQVFSSEGCIFSDDGKKADYQRRLTESENASKASDSALDSAEPAPAPAKKAARKTAKKASKQSAD